MHNLFRLHDPAETRCRCCRKKGVEAFFQIRRWRAVHSHGSEPIALTIIQGAKRGLAKAGSVLQHGLEYWFKLAQ